jgi:putative hydroxymethylpyrimidine transport system permease protein
MVMSESKVAVASVPAPTIAAKPRRRVGRRLLRSYGPAAGLIVLLVVLWQVIFELTNVPTYLVPKPSEIATSLHDDWGLLWPATWITLQETLLGFAFALVGAVLIAILLHTSATIRGAIYPLLIGSQTVPIIVIGPVLVIILGYNIWPKLIVVGLVCFFPIVVNMLDGLSSVSGEYGTMMKTLYGSRLNTFWRVELPASMPMTFSGVRVGIAYAAIGAVVGEWSGSNGGLGYSMLEAEPNLQTARIFAIIFILTMISAVLFSLVSIIQYYSIPWARLGKSTGK